MEDVPGAGGDRGRDQDRPGEARGHARGTQGAQRQDWKGSAGELCHRTGGMDELHEGRKLGGQDADVPVPGQEVREVLPDAIGMSRHPLANLGSASNRQYRGC